MRSSTFRPIHYLGNKLRALDAIDDAVATVVAPGATVCDLFAGSAVVSRRLADRYQVLAVDIQQYAKVLADALLNPRPIARPGLNALRDFAAGHADELEVAGFRGLVELEESAIADAFEGRLDPLIEIVEHGSAGAYAVADAGVPPRLAARLSVVRTIRTGAEAAISRYYGGVYFSYRQAVELDALGSAIRAIDDPAARATALGALLSTASDVVSTVGNQFAQPLRPRRPDGTPKASTIIPLARRRQVAVGETFERWLARYSRLERPAHAGRSVRADFRQALDDLPAEVRGVYADPPYTRDHYSRFYHVLETIARGDDPGVSTVTEVAGLRASRGLYREERHQSPFCIPRQVGAAFEALFGGVAARGIPLVLSYSPLSSGTAARPQTRLRTIEELVVAAEAVFGEVTVRSAGSFAHSKLNAAHLNAEANYEAEVLIVCCP